jgi:hypothetical protein
MVAFFAAEKRGRRRGTEDATITRVFSTITQRKKRTVLSGFGRVVSAYFERELVCGGRWDRGITGVI